MDAAIIAICYLAASPKLQHMLLESGALAVLIPLLLQYDVTLSAEASARLQLPFTATAAVSTASAAGGSDQAGLGPQASGLRLLDMALVRPNMQEARSQHALLAAQALARLAGKPHAAAARLQRTYDCCCRQCCCCCRQCLEKGRAADQALPKLLSACRLCTLHLLTCTPACHHALACVQACCGGPSIPLATRPPSRHWQPC